MKSNVTLHPVDAPYRSIFLTLIAAPERNAAHF